MKLRFTYVLFFSAFCLIVLQSRSGGVAKLLSQDRTGGPFTTGTCASCHAGGSFGTTFGVTVKDAQGLSVSNYVPGSNYSVEFQVSSTLGSRYAMQGVALTSMNQQAGAFGTPTSTKTQVVALNNRQYVEHNGTATSSSGGFKFIVPWTAPAQGTGDITFYGMGLTVNGSGTSGDQASPAHSHTIQEMPVANSFISSSLVNNDMVVYPNPNNGSFTVKELFFEGKTRISVRDMQGKLLYNRVLRLNGEASINLELPTMPNGVYHLELANEQSIKTSKLIIFE